MAVWKLGVIEPVYHQLLRNAKKVETRAPDPSNPEKDYGLMMPGDELHFHAVDEEFKPIVDLPVLGFLADAVREYQTIEDCLRAEGLQLVFPGIASIEAATQIYYSFPDYPERIQKYGLVAAELGKRLF